jgi:hypothetical protein
VSISTQHEKHPLLKTNRGQAGRLTKLGLTDEYYFVPRESDRYNRPGGRTARRSAQDTCLEVPVNGGAVGGILCVLLIGLPIGLLIGAVILRGGVSFANKCLPKESERDDRYWDDEDEDEDEDEDDRPRRSRRRAKAAIPEPGVGKAMGIVLVGAIVGFIISIPINLVLGVGLGGPNGGNQDQAMSILASLIQLPIGFLVNAGIRTGMLPTTFGRACLVVVFEYLIAIAICLIIAVPLVLLFVVAR